MLKTKIRVLGFVALCAVGTITPILTTSCSKKDDGKKEANAILHRITIDTIDEEQSQLRGAYTRKLLKKGDPDAITKAYDFSLKTNDQVQKIIASDGIISAYSYLNDAAKEGDADNETEITLADWGNFDAQHKQMTESIKKSINNVSGLSKNHKQELIASMLAVMQKEEEKAKENNSSMDEFELAMENDFAEQMGSIATERALIAKTGLDLEMLTNSNVLLEKRYIPDPYDLRELEVNQDISSDWLPILFSLNSINSPFTEDSLSSQGYTASAKIVSITPNNWYEYNIEIEISLCLTDHISESQYKQSVTINSTFTNSLFVQKQLATQLFSDANFSSLGLDGIVPYKILKDEFWTADTDSMAVTSSLSHLFSYSEGCDLLNKDVPTNFNLIASASNWNDYSKQVDITLDIFNGQNKVVYTKKYASVQLSLTDEEKYDLMYEAKDKLVNYRTAFSYYRNKDSIDNYWNFMLAYSIAETTLLAISIGLAALYWSQVVWTFGLSIAFAVAATAVAALSAVMVGVAWAEHVGVNDLKKDFDEKWSTEGFKPAMDFFNSHTEMIDSLIDDINTLDPNDSVQIRTKFSKFSDVATKIFDLAYPTDPTGSIAIVFVQIFTGGFAVMVAAGLSITIIMGGFNFVVHTTYLTGTITFVVFDLGQAVGIFTETYMKATETILRYTSWGMKTMGASRLFTVTETTSVSFSWAVPAVAIASAIFSVALMIIHYFLSKDFYDMLEQYRN